MTRKLFSFLLALLLLLPMGIVSAQLPQHFSYQAVVRHANNRLAANETVSVRISLLKGSAEGAVVYSELHRPTTNVNGLFSLVVGEGNRISGSIDAIDWSNVYFLKSEIDPDGGNDYTAVYVSQLLGVPYAFYANRAKSVQGLSDSLSDVRSALSDTAASLRNTLGAMTESDPSVPAWAKAAAKPAYDYSEIANTPAIPTVPTNVSAFTNDAGYITTAAVPTAVSELTNDAGYITTAAVPTAVSELTNDAGYITTSAVPTNVSELTNDAGYLTSYTESDPSVPAWAKTATKPAYDYSEIENTPAIPTVPTAVSAFTNDAGYITSSAVPTNVSELTNDAGYITTSAVPTAVSELTNDAGYITTSAVPTNVSELTNDAGYITGYTESDPSVPAWAKAATKPAYDYSEIENTPAIPTVPTAVSAFTNDAGYITTAAVPTAVSELTNDAGYITTSAVPTNVSELTNDAGYLTSYTESDPNVPAWAKAATKPAYDYSEIENTPTIPTVPTAVSAFTNDAGYITTAAVPTNVSELTNDAGYITTAAVPTAVSELTNDAGYITTAAVPTAVSELTNDAGYLTSYTESDPNVPAWAKSDTKPAYDYSEIENTPTIPTVPTAVSAFTNDAGYITTAAVPTAVSELTNDAGYITTSAVPTNVSELTNDAGYLTSYTESDPSVPAWAKADTKPAYDYSEIENTPTIPTVPTAVSAFTNDAGYITEFTETQTLESILSDNTSAGNHKISNVANPEAAQDVVTLAYLQALIEPLINRISSLENTVDSLNQQLTMPGSGTEEDPFTIYDENSLRYFCNFVNSKPEMADKYYRVSRSFSCQNPVTPVSSFSGVFDGGGYAIVLEQGYVLRDDYQYALFVNAAGARIFDLAITSPDTIDIELPAGVAANIAAFVAQDVDSMDNCHNGMTLRVRGVSGGKVVLGGLVATLTMPAKIVSSSNVAALLVEAQNAEVYIGGLVGYDGADNLSINNSAYTLENYLMGNISSENLQAAESRIRDVDVGSEMMEFSKNNLLQQDGQSMLAQGDDSTPDEGDDSTPEEDTATQNTAAVRSLASAASVSTQSLNAQRNLAAMSRVQTGLKINSAADDAAGYAISERMRAQISMISSLGNLFTADKYADDNIKNQLKATISGGIAYVGGLVGYQEKADAVLIIHNSYVDGQVVSTGEGCVVGGFIGKKNADDIDFTYNYLDSAVVLIGGADAACFWSGQTGAVGTTNRFVVYRGDGQEHEEGEEGCEECYKQRWYFFATAARDVEAPILGFDYDEESEEEEWYYDNLCEVLYDRMMQLDDAVNANRWGEPTLGHVRLWWIARQAAQSMLAQANQSSQTVLDLLQ